MTRCNLIASRFVRTIPTSNHFDRASPNTSKKNQRDFATALPREVSSSGQRKGHEEKLNPLRLTWATAQRILPRRRPHRPPSTFWMKRFLRILRHSSVFCCRKLMDAGREDGMKH